MSGVSMSWAEKGIVAGAVVGAVAGGILGGPAGAAAGALAGASVVFVVYLAGGVVYLAYEGIKWAVESYQYRKRMRASELQQDQNRARAAAEQEALHQERAKLLEEKTEFGNQKAQQEVELASRRAQQEAKAVELARQGALVEQKDREVKAAVQQRERKTETREAAADEKARKAEEQEKIADQKLVENEKVAAFLEGEFLRLTVEKMNLIRSNIDMMIEEIPGITLARIKERVKKHFPTTELFFEDELRDPKTDAFLDDCVLGPDGRHYNRSTLIDLYEKGTEAKEQGEGVRQVDLGVAGAARLFYLANPSDRSKMPTDDALRARIQTFQDVGLSKALSLSSTNPEAISSRERVDIPVPTVETPLKIEKISGPSQADSSRTQTFLKAPEGYCALFIPRRKPAVGAPPVEAAIVVEKYATAGVRGG